MKLIAIKPIYFEGNVLTAGSGFETLEQHGRELIQKGYAKLEESEHPEPKPDKKAKK